VQIYGSGLKTHVKERNIDAITSVDKLKAAITTAWMNVPNSYVHWLYNSIPRRLRAAVTSEGNITIYQILKVNDYVYCTKAFLVNVH